MQVIDWRLIRTIGSIWQCAGAEKVRKNGAKIERVMRERLWEKFPEEGMPGPHVP